MGPGPHSVLAAAKGRKCLSIASALAFVSVLSTLVTPSGVAQAGAITTTPAVRVHSFVTGLPVIPPPSLFAGSGPAGLTFSHSGRLFVSDAANSGLYSFGPMGSNAPTPLSTGSVQTGLAFGRGGQLFAALYQAGNIDQIDPATGAFIRQLNPSGTTYPCVIGLAADPASGDLFFGQTNSGGVCPGNAVLTRVENPTSAHPTFVAYSAQPAIYYEGLTFGSDGTLYAVQQGASGACAVRISGTRSLTPPTITTIACFPNFGQFIGIETIALSNHVRDPSAGNQPSGRGPPLLFVAGPSGTITEIDQSTTPPTLTPVVTLSTRIDDMAVGPDCRLYATQSTGIDRIVQPGGACCGGQQRADEENRCQGRQ